jgi:hypothetical protein
MNDRIKALHPKNFAEDSGYNDGLCANSTAISAMPGAGLLLDKAMKLRTADALWTRRKVHCG